MNESAPRPAPAGTWWSRRTPQASRAAGFALAAVLVLLSAAAMAGSWHQANVVSRAASAAQAADACTEARYLAAVQNAADEEALGDPTSLAVRTRHRDVGARLVATLNRARRLDVGDAALLDAVIGDQAAYLAMINRFFDLADAHRAADAADLRTTQIEPIERRVLAAVDTLVRDSRDASVRARRDLRRDTRLLLLGAPIALGAGLLLLVLLTLITRTHRRTMEEQAAYDPLTGLPNRALFLRRSAQALAAAARTGAEPAVLLLDLNDFKQVNDTLGHHLGDQLLIQVAARLTKTVRAHDTAARLGGDEFALLLGEGGRHSGSQVAERIAEQLQQPFLLDGVLLDVEASVGVAVATASEDVPTLLRHADTAMYVAKKFNLGHAHYTAEQDENTLARLTLLSDLRRALDADEFELHYQPKIAMDTGDLTGVEALARWRHPERGLLFPGDFIAATDATSLCYPFTTYVIDKALRHSREWLDRGVHLPVAVNVSTRCLLDQRLPETVAALLHAAGMSADALCLEVTESSIMADPQRALDILSRIRALGVKTSIDDFGTGYSSMAYLKLLPVDELKIDRSFVGDMAADPRNAMLVQSTIDLGHNLGLSVTAEGVEDATTLAALHSLGCDVAQGYYLGRPLNPAAFASWLRARDKEPAGNGSAT